MLHKTKGLVLRGVKYGESSLIVSIYTETLGIQSYIVNGVRSASPRQPYRANLFQPATLLDLVVYHNERHSLQRIREFRWASLYNDIYRNVHKNTVALFMTELLQKCLKQPEPNPDLFAFLEDAFIHLDRSTPRIAANFPLYFTIHLAHFFGFRIQDEHDGNSPVLDLREGQFVGTKPEHPDFLEGIFASTTSQLLKTRQPDELEQLELSREQRHYLLDAYISFYTLHQPEFGTFRSLPVLQAIYGF